MPKFFIKSEQIKDNSIDIIGSDVNHIKNVLRTKVGEEIELCNIETSQNYKCQIQEIEKEKIVCNIIEKINSQTEGDIKVTIFQGLPKADKMELIIQKSVELGAYDITPVEMGRCIVKLNEKDKAKKIERWQKISEVAAKQCGRDTIPQVNEVLNINDICNNIDKYDVIIVAYEKEQSNTIKRELKRIKQEGLEKIGIVIGPEGGFEEKEVEKLEQSGAKIITLGKRILRTETVALNVLSNIIYELEIEE